LQPAALTAAERNEFGPRRRNPVVVALALFVALCLVVGLIGGIVLAATRSSTDKVAPNVTLPTVAPANDGGQSIEQFIRWPRRSSSSTGA
jgi:hypothetical protein